MKPSLEKLILPAGESFRCFNRRSVPMPSKWHQHAEVELTYVERGAGSRLVGDHIGSYSDGDLVLLGSELPHTWRSDAYQSQPYDRHPAVVIQFHPQFLGAEFFQVGELAGIAAMLAAASRGLWFPSPVAQSVGARMTEMVELAGAARLVTLLHCLAELCGCVESAIPLASRSYTTAKNRDAKTRIQLVCNYVEQHLADGDLDHAMLARLVSMNPSAFSRFFKKATGRTVTAYVTELRIGLACRLLADTEDSILAISMRSGFGNLSNFNRRFRQLRAMTPREFRARHQGVSARSDVA